MQHRRTGRPGDAAALRRHPLPGPVPLLVLAAVALIVVACGGSAGPLPATAPAPSPASTGDVADLPTAFTASCELSGAPSAFPLQAVPGADPAPTAFDSVNTATCVFTEPVVSITVTLRPDEGPAAQRTAHIEVIEVDPPSILLTFPLVLSGERKILSSLLPLGRYTRAMLAASLDGATLDIGTPELGASTEVFLVDVQNATAFLR